MTYVRPLVGPPAHYLHTVPLLLLSGAIEKFVESLKSESFNALETAAINHEIIHHIQVLSSPFLYLSSHYILQTALRLLRANEATTALSSHSHYLRLKAQLRHRVRGVSVRDLVEGSAVLESFKLTWPGADSETFVRFRKSEFPGRANSPYRRTFDVLSYASSSEIAFDLLNPLTFIALQTTTPGETFDLLIRNPRVVSGILVGRSFQEIRSELHLREDLCKWVEDPEQIPLRDRHACFLPLFVYLKERASFNNLLETFARPSRLASPDHQSLRSLFIPPVVIGAYKDGASSFARFFGIAADDKRYSRMVLDAAGAVFAADALCEPRQLHVPCLRSECLNHASGLCGGWFAPPADYNACGFRASIKELTGIEIRDVAMRVRRWVAPSVEQNAYETRELFPSANLPDNGDSLADQMDHELMLDEEDNDASIVLLCNSCRASIAIKASLRYVECGFSAPCPKCGEPLRVDIEEMPLLRLERKGEKHY